MRLFSITEMLNKARKEHYAVGAFNVLNLEMFQAIVNAAEAEKSPVIIQVWYGDLAHIGGEYIGAVARTAAKSATYPIALQLDHGQTFDQVRSCINWGFSSIMIDLSSSSFNDNVRYTKEAIEEAHGNGVSVEAELGRIFSGFSSIEEQRSSLTDPDRAAEFVEETGVDALAVSVGTAHGVYRNGPIIDFHLLERLIQRVQVPIVIHGGSFTSNADIIRMIDLGAAKINIGTELMIEFVNSMKDMINEKKQDVSARELLGYAQRRVENLVKKKIKILNTRRTTSEPRR
jgi:ketose-bisphosphate aldolase